jgi:autotransporter-associated beta strand protein
MSLPFLSWLGGSARTKRRSKSGTRGRCPVLTLERLETRELPATWAALNNLVPGSSGAQSMMLLSDGTVMIHGGADNTSSSWYRLTPDSSGSYINGTFSTLASSNLKRLFFTSDMLPNGKVLVIGGEYSNDPNGSFTNTGEIFDPLGNPANNNGTWTSITNFPQTKFGDDPSEVLANGTVLAGYYGNSATYIWTPTASTTAPGTWAATGSKIHSDRSDEESWVKLPDGSILSYDVFNSPASGAGTSQRYLQSSATWVDGGSVPVPLTGSAFGRELGPALLLPPMNGATQGNVFQIGANGNTVIYTPPPAGSSATGSWATGPVIPMNGSHAQGADDAPAAELPNGQVIFLADTNSPDFTAPSQIFTYDPVANTITQQTTSNTTFPSDGSLTNSLNGNGSFIYYMLDLPNGDVLLSSSVSRQLWEFTPTAFTPNPAWAPTISSIAFNSGLTYTLTGTQINGMSEGANYGDDAEMASNYPIVRLTAGSNVYYARTFNWSSTGVQTGSTPVTTQFTLPANLPFTTYSVSVVANGIASTTPMTLTPPVYADTRWAGMANGMTVTDADPVLAGNQGAVIGTNAFATVTAAIAAEPAGGVVIINGGNGANTFGNFAEPVNVNKQLTLYLQQGPVTFGSLTGAVATANIVLSTGVALTAGGDNTSTEYDGAYSGTGSFSKAGSGTMTLGGANTNTGATNINGGVLQVNGSLLNAGAVSVAVGATLGGIGSVGGTTVSGTLAPGNTVGILHTGGLSFNANSTMSVQVMGPTAGTNYSQVIAGGPISLTGATLALSVANGYTPSVGVPIDILENNSGSAITGTFNNLPEGATVSSNGLYFTISYVGSSGGGAGNDVVLTAAGAPPPPTVANVQVGDGTVQRSEVRSIAVTFSSAVTFAGGNVNAAAAFQLQHVQDATNVSNLTAVVSTNVFGQTVVTLTFTTNGNMSTEIDPISAENGGAASLADGRYQLTILSASVTGAGNQSLAGGGPNGNYVSPTDTQGGGPGQLRLFRLFADLSGDGLDDQIDLGTFRTAYNTVAGDPNYVANLDADNDGKIDQIDLGEFRNRNNTSVF